MFICIALCRKRPIVLWCPYLRSPNASQSKAVTPYREPVVAVSWFTVSSTCGMDVQRKYIALLESIS
jgi:hypothetical protein